MDKKIPVIAIIALTVTAAVLSLSALIRAAGAADIYGRQGGAVPAFADYTSADSYDGGSNLPRYTENGFSADGVLVREKTFDFEDGGIFSVIRFEADTEGYELAAVPIGAATGVQEAQNEEFRYHIHRIPISGNEISVRSQNFDVSPAEWLITEDIADLPAATLFIETERETVIISIPAVYRDGGHNTIIAEKGLERAATIEEEPEGYSVVLEFPISEGIFGEFWMYRSAQPSLSELNEALWIRQDLHKNRRFSLDGYYFRTYENYRPYDENGFFRNPANFTGAQILEEGASPFKDIGYAMTKICAANQNPMGFWETGPMSEWLRGDYGIGYGFYDTRFSTDFARSLLTGYTLYGDKDFLNSALFYADFLIRYADEFGYTNDAVGSGVLLPDYWSVTMETRPHVSLNHQLAEINFLLEAYLVTGTEIYKQYAMKMLAGIESTESLWILEDGNLAYAILYEETSNTMQDYPFLTYNDLYETMELLNEVGERSDTINALMLSKREWMDRNGVVGYKTDATD